MIALSPSPFLITKGDNMRFEINGNVTTVYDNKGKSFLIDTDQIEKVFKYNWSVVRKGYVRTASRKINRITLHRYLLDTDKTVDHINRIPTDNRLSNLRICTVQENNRNRVYRNTKSGAQGVNIVTKNGKQRYRVRLCVDGKRISCGQYATLEEAKRVYEEKVKEIFKAYAPVQSQDS